MNQEKWIESEMTILLGNFYASLHVGHARRRSPVINYWNTSERLVFEGYYGYNFLENLLSKIKPSLKGKSKQSLQNE